MPYGFKWSGISAIEDKVKAEDIMDGIEATEEFVNQGIAQSSFRTSDVVSDSERAGHTSEGFIEKRHIFKPDFYGSPSPRMEAVSSQVHWRTTGQSDMDGVIFTPSNSGGGWDTIPGTATRLKLRDHANVFFMSTFYCYEFGGLVPPKGLAGQSSGPFADRHDALGGETRRAGTVALGIHGADGRKTEYAGSTRRYIYTSTLYPRGPSFGGTSAINDNGFCLLSMLGRHQHSITATLTLPPGVYDIGLVFSCRNSDGTVYSNAKASVEGEIDGGKIPMNKTVFFMARNMVCDAVYNKRAAAEEELELWRTINDKDPQAI